MNLKGKIALITGGSRGIGKAIAIAFAKAGAKGIIINYKSNDEKALETKKILENLGAETLLVKKDLSNISEVRDLAKESVKHFGKVDILVNNAGVLMQKPFEEIKENEWDEIFNVNLKAPFFLIQELIPYMIKQNWGRIINIASIGGQIGGNLAVHYASSKAGLISLTLSIARIYSKYGITSNAISPGLIETDMSKEEINSPIGKEKLKNIPVGRFGTTEEVAEFALFLASEKASYITGQTFNINGGMLFSHGL